MSVVEKGKWIVMAASVAALFASGQAWAEGTLADALTGGKPLVDSRLRYEGVSDDGCAACAGRYADAKTFRARVGYQTGTWRGFTALAEFDQIWSLGPENYNSLSNGHTIYPAVADPAVTALNRLQLTYKDDSGTAVTAGRQRIVLGNARFIGNVGFRQHEQTFDGVTAVNTSLPDTTLTYAWIGGVNRVFGPDSHAGAAIGHYVSDSHVFNAVYAGIPGLTLQGYAYLLDLKEAPAASTATYGLNAQWKFVPTDSVAAVLTGVFAHQNHYGKNPNPVDLDYWDLEAVLGYAGISAGIGYEAMGGNGTVGFATPLATLHAFDGWADLFLTTPKNGIDDLNAQLSYAWPGVLGVTTLASQIVYHSFTTDRLKTGIGTEWDAALNAGFTGGFALSVSYAAYRSSGLGLGGFKDKTITWLTASYHL